MFIGEIVIWLMVYAGVTLEYGKPALNHISTLGAGTFMSQKLCEEKLFTRVGGNIQLAKENGKYFLKETLDHSDLGIPNQYNEIHCLRYVVYGEGEVHYYPE